MRNSPRKQFKSGASVEFRDTGLWIRGAYLNAYGTWHIVEDCRGHRIAVADRDIHKYTRVAKPSMRKRDRGK